MEFQLIHIKKSVIINILSGILLSAIAVVGLFLYSIMEEYALILICTYIAIQSLITWFASKKTFKSVGLLKVEDELVTISQYGFQNDIKFHLKEADFHSSPLNNKIKLFGSFEGKMKYFDFFNKRHEDFYDYLLFQGSKFFFRVSSKQDLNNLNSITKKSPY